MAKLRHLAMQVPDLEKAASFYQNVFEFKRVHQVETTIGNAIMLSDGVMNLTLLNFPPGTRGEINGPDWAGLHHFGVIVDDKDATTQKIKQNGGKLFMDASTEHANEGTDVEVKFRDPNGVVFDIAESPWHA